MLLPLQCVWRFVNNPVLLAFSVGKDKDTCRNVEETGEFVINVPGENILKEMMVTQHNKALIIFIVFFMRSNFDCLGMKDTAHSGERRR
jgi:flavin reductase (DIM6/NTAB) family NADH-FMN oxidoreductase RutF